MFRNYSLLSYGRVYNPYNWYYNPSYVVNRIYYIISGTAFYKNSIPLKPGYMYVFRASPDFKVHQEADDPVDHVFFDFSTYKGLCGKEYIEIDLSEDKMLGTLASLISEDFKTPVKQPEIVKDYFEILLYYLRDYLESDGSYSEVTIEALSLLHNTPLSELSVNMLASGLKRNVNHIIRCFKKDIGITPHKYINELKVNMAIAYIKQGLSCTEAAEKLGFSSISAFSYFFRHATGKNFSDYRKDTGKADYENSRYYNV